MLGWIKLHRCLLNKPIWLQSTPEQKTILMTLLMMANHKGKEWEWKGETYKAEPGQFVTSLDKIVEKSGKGISIQNVRTSLKRFEKYEFLTNEPTNKNRLITIVNWGIYQGDDDEPNKQTNKQLTSNQQATNKQLTTNKNDKNDKNEKKEINNSAFDDFWNIYRKKKNKAQSIKKFEVQVKKHGKDKIINGAKSYMDEMKDTDLKYIKNPDTFLNQETFLDYEVVTVEEKPVMSEALLKALRSRKRDLEKETEGGIESFKAFGQEPYYNRCVEELRGINERLRNFEETN